LPVAAPRGYARAPERPAAAPEAPPVAPAPAAEPVGMTPEEVATKLNDAFYADRPGDETAGNRRVAIAAAFRSPAASGAALRDIDCRATRCRMAVEFTDTGADRRVVSELFNLLEAGGLETRELGFTIPTREERSDGSVVATIHLYHAAGTL
jgi:hypothetical protein